MSHSEHKRFFYRVTHWSKDSREKIIKGNGKDGKGQKIHHDTHRDREESKSREQVSKIDS